MSTPRAFRLPDVGEGLIEADILTWLVKPGDVVEVNQPLVEIETAKAAVELPSPYGGTVVALLAEAGQTVPVGDPIITIQTGEPDGTAGVAVEQVSDVPRSSPRESAEQPPMLVGYGARDERLARRRNTGPRAVPSVASGESVRGVPIAPQPTSAVARPAAKPPVRKLAKDLGVDLGDVVPSGANGTITREDVRRALDEPAPAQRLRVVSDTDRETRVPIRGVRKHTARAMVESAFTAPHVTEFVTVDVTETVRLRDVIAARPDFRDVKLTPLAFVARALLLAVQRTPDINATWDEAAQEIVFKHYVNLGIAAATERGLVVPNIKDADQLGLRELAMSISALATAARDGKTSLADMTGGTITITNVGVFGVDTGTPILNPGEAAILAVGAIRRQPWVVGTGADERIEPRWVTQLALSFDHRLVDGQQGSQALANIAAVLNEPGFALL